MRDVGSTRRFASFDQECQRALDQSHEKAFMTFVFRHRYFELNILDFLLISEAKLSAHVFLDVVPEKLSAEVCASHQSQ